MSSAPIMLEIGCAACEWRGELTLARMAEELARNGSLRRMRAPEEDLVLELFRAYLPRRACPTCGHLGCVEFAASDDWTKPKPCETCGRPIERDRLEALPDAVLCLTCQRTAEQGGDGAPADYCPRCGAELGIARRTQGVTAYVITCSACGWKRK